MGDLENFLSRLEHCKRQLEKEHFSQATILHHDEADGLASAALTKLSLEHLGLKTRLICLDKLYPEVVADVQASPKQAVAYADIGSGHIDLLIKNNKAGNLIFTLDHHDTKESRDPMVLNLNPELDRFSGEKEASSATIAYLFARTVDENLRSFSHLALIGSMEIPGEPRGLNSLAVKDAEDQKLAERSGKGDFRITARGMSFGRGRIVTMLNVLGSVGYYHNGPEIGVRACIEGFGEETISFAAGLEEKRRASNQKTLAEIRGKGLNQKKTIQWFHARDNYSGMSGKVVGSFCSYLRYQRGINPMKYLIGMMNVPPEIPGWGTLPAPIVKVSGRAPQRLAELIEKGERQGLSRILPEACARVGGFGDGHTVAASGAFPAGREEQFLEEIDRLAGGA